jgi:thioredoxin 1
MLQVLKFGAPWCGPCKMLNPVIDELKEEMTNVEFESVDVDQDPGKAAEYGVMGIPRVFIIKDGEKVEDFTGFKPKDVIKELIEAHK